MLEEGLYQYRATLGLAALGFPNGAESGMWRRNWSNMELMRVLGIVRVMQYPYSKIRAIVNCAFVGLFWINRSLFRRS
jgi:hypothetical protein